MKWLEETILQKLEDIGMLSLDPYQTGFVKGESTNTNATIFLNEIVKNSRKKKMLYLLLDTRKAYDTVNRAKLKEILEELAKRS